MARFQEDAGIMMRHFITRRFAAMRICRIRRASRRRARHSDNIVRGRYVHHLCQMRPGLSYERGREIYDYLFHDESFCLKRELFVPLPG